MEWQTHPCLQELLLKLVEDHYPLPPDPDELQINGKRINGSKASVSAKGKRRKAETPQEAVKGRKRARQKANNDCNGFGSADDHGDADFGESNLPCMRGQDSTCMSRLV